ncbi:MarR family transcriptional regulator [Streptomyces halstedii]|uniref:MarR family winged helix-turn-helix transcriptional regulator n=1 Tax=Streptomyces halstedii TaxID=1944 RepID=UPI00345F3126
MRAEGEAAHAGAKSVGADDQVEGLAVPRAGGGVLQQYPRRAVAFGDLCGRDLATFLGLDKSTLSGLVDRAVRRGLMTRAPNHDDKRAVDVLITDAGRELTERLYGEVRAALAPATGRLDEQQRRLLAELLEPVLTPPLPLTQRPAAPR